MLFTSTSTSNFNQPLLLIDGYNIIGAWTWLKSIRDRDGLEFSRKALIETVINYTGYQELEAKVVFDAHYQKNPSYEEQHGIRVSVCYTSFAETADTYIEKFCASFPRRKPKKTKNSRLIVATSDQAQRHTVVGYGAEWMSAQTLAKEIETTKKKAKRNNRPRQKPQGRFLFNSLDAETQQALSQMRLGIK